MALDYEYGYTIAPPKPQDPQDSAWQKIYNDFLEKGVDREKYRPGYTPPTGDEQAAARGGAVARAIGMGGNNADTGTDRPGGTDAGTTGGGLGEVGGDPMGPGGVVSENRDIGPTNPVDTGLSFIDQLNRDFPGGLEGRNPSKIEQWIVEHGDLAMGAVGYLMGIPGLKWLANKIQDLYWRTNQWQSPIPEGAQNSPTYGADNLVDEILGNGPDGTSPDAEPRQSPVGTGPQGYTGIRTPTGSRIRRYYVNGQQVTYAQYLDYMKSLGK